MSSFHEKKTISVEFEPKIFPFSVFLTTSFNLFLYSASSPSHILHKILFFPPPPTPSISAPFFSNPFSLNFADASKFRPPKILLLSFSSSILASFLWNSLLTKPLQEKNLNAQFAPPLAPLFWG
eukprot:Sdes_comp19999_c0_seq1m12637